VAAGLAVQRSSIVCWDRESGTALSPVLSWRDRRHAEWLAGLELDPHRIQELTGLVISPHYGASKLRWCLDHLPAVAAAARDGRLCLGPLASFLAFRLLEQRPCIADPANAARTLLYDLSTGDWSDELLDGFGLPRESLPRVVPARDALGTLRQGALRAELQVLAGDQPAALFAWGEPGPDTLFVNIGTGAFVQRVVVETASVDPRLLRSIAWAEPGREVRVVEGTVNGAGAALQWLARRRGVPLDELLAGAPRWLDESCKPPLFINGVGGLAAPFWRPDCPVQFTAETGIEQEAVAVIESIVFLLQANIEAMLGGAAEAPRRILATGGLARLDGLCRRLASLSGLPVVRPGECEATAMGLARLLGAPALPMSRPDRFQPGSMPELSARYRAWRRLLD
jgi:glycerol kinase